MAGIYPAQLLVDMSAEDWDRIQAINLRSAFLCCREAVRSLQARSRPGRIVSISSRVKVRGPAQLEDHDQSLRIRIRPTTIWSWAINPDAKTHFAGVEKRRVGAD